MYTPSHLEKQNTISQTPISRPQLVRHEVARLCRRTCTIAFISCYTARWDLVCMYDDVEWQVSPEFLKAGEHAMAYANITRSIMIVDPHFHFLYRLFGTYLVQSLFIFLIFARKFGSMSDPLILDNCAVNLQVLDIFVQNSNMTYQRDFAKILRKALSRCVADRSLGSGEYAHSAETAKELLDPELLRYRWIAGYGGLWASSNELASR